MNEFKNSGCSGLKKKFKMSIVLLIVMLLIMTVFFVVILSVLIGSFSVGDVGLGYDDVARKLRFIRACALLGGPVIAVLTGVSFYRSYKRREALMCETEPIECTVKDFLITSTYYKNKRRYFITPVLENVKTGELYCSPKHYDMSFYSTAYSQVNRSLRSINILRGDGSKVEIGDAAWVYIKEIVTPGVTVSGDEYTIDNRSHKFNNVNKDIGIEMIYRLTFFSGIVDVERY